MPKDWDIAHRPAPLIERPELPSLRGISDSDQRFYLRNYLRSNMQKDLDEAKVRCEAAGVDFDQAKREAAQT